MVYSADYVFLTVAINHPQPPHRCPPGIDDPERLLIIEHHVGPVLLCPLLILFAESDAFLHHGQGKQQLLCGHP